MDINNQTNYWDKVADQKVFTHPLDLPFLQQHIGKDAAILDYGCGYGRIVAELLAADYTNVTGFDTSEKLVQRGLDQQLPLQHVENVDVLPLSEATIDAVLLFAVLTCIPTNAGQQHLIDILYDKLRPGGIIYISDYYLQANTDRYTWYEGDKDNYGVFTLPEGATLRHHPREWIQTLLKRFTILDEQIISVKTMNGNPAEIFQLIARK
ncbi:class I SAM-dependent methyltransferase [Chitinophaga pinensis]|uniref:Methyltransferase type 12 n=1 Tax=Chitinophaga pinensis (strain ATCC 43595 / DSM 2588 / LMG 13176 / NBRC 15968 / NCIMB 11800 / UQM 2034) TaxID=485918 RepID=A0A979G6D8_CHIPD|nr:class I SAM-dependent methyltransferase [Chitinophaga pinensis]ACU61647.1 Methyltransferase type 12 [Chitinophaga pinensis DSM 2588]